jgi:hypothetical protein
MRETNMPGDFVDVRAKRRWRVVVTIVDPENWTTS